MDNFIKGLPCAVTVCDKDGVILDMNLAAEHVFESDGGKNLIGTNLLDCHPEPSRTKLKKMLNDEITNTYTIEKNGKRKIIHQVPWYDNGIYGGFVEISFEVPDKMPNFVRS